MTLSDQFGIVRNLVKLFICSPPPYTPMPPPHTPPYPSRITISPMPRPLKNGRSDVANFF